MNSGFIICGYVFFAALNTSPAVLVILSWANKYVVVYGVPYLFNIEKVKNGSTVNQIPSIVLRDQSTSATTTIDPLSLNDTQIIDNMMEFENYAKLVILFFALSSCFSFILFITALACTYTRQCIWIHKCCTRRHRQQDLEAAVNQQNVDEQEIEPLDPFCADLEPPPLPPPPPTEQQEQQQQQPPPPPLRQTTSTRLDLPESLYFISLLLLNIGICGVGIYIFCDGHYNKEYYGPYNISVIAEATGFSVYMYSLFCTIGSCFIFSKLAYSVTHNCLKLIDNLKAGRYADNDHGRDLLIADDNRFTQQAQATLNWFEYWFTVHWIFYTVTSFLSIALFWDMLTMHIQSKYLKVPPSAVGFSINELWVVGLFTLSHCFLFLYPCFKAAAVTVSRNKLIKKINETDHFALERKQLLIQYLKNKNFGFRISFFCARLQFSFNVAYISIFIGLLGVLLKVTGVF